MISQFSTNQLPMSVNPLSLYVRFCISKRLTNENSIIDHGNPIAFPIPVSTTRTMETTTRDNADAGKKTTSSNRVTVVTFLDQLQKVEKIRSVEDERKVAEWAKELMQVLYEILKGSSRKFLTGEERAEQIDFYRIALNEILSRTTMKVEEKAIRDLFFVAGDLEITAQSLESLTVFKTQQDFNIKLDLLEELFSNEMTITAALVQGSFSSAVENDSQISVINRNLVRDRFVTRLINIPTTIANFAAGNKISAPFVDNYVKIIYRNILRAFLTIVQLNGETKVQRFGYDLLGKLLSKTITNFGSNNSSVEVMERFYEILSAICRDNATTFRAPIDQLLSKVNSCAAIEATLICLLNKCRNWRHCLSPQLLHLSGDWEFVVKRSIPLRSYVRDVEFPRKFVQFLAICDEKEEEKQNENSILEDVLTELLSCWAQNGDRSLEQHIFVSRLIIFLIMAMRRKKSDLSTTMATLIKQKIYNGIPSHLQSLDMNLRFVGMRMAEVVLNILETVAEEDRLDFGAAKLKADEEVQKMFEGFDLEEDSDVEGAFEEDLEDILSGLEMKTNVESEKRVALIQNATPVATKSLKVVNLEPLDSDDDEIPLDEDDDLVPYDLSNDVDEEEVVAPKYLLDLKETLVQSTDDKVNAEKFSAGLKVCAELIRNQLPLNDSGIGVELLSIFIHLNNKVYNEQFAEQRMEGCVAVVEVIPKQAAEFLCGEFYSDPGLYAISHQILMLDVLVEAARRLSKLSTKSKDEGKENKQIVGAFKKLAIKDSDAEKKKEINKIIAERLSEKTRRFGNRALQSGGPVEGVNRFHAVAGSFIFPLISGFGKKQIIFQSRAKLKDDTTNVLLFSFIKALCVLTLCAENAPNIRKILSEELHLIALLRFYAEERVQMAVLELIGCVMTVTPKEMMATDFLQSFLEIKAWLEELVERNNFNSDMNRESRELARRLLSYL